MHGTAVLVLGIILNGVCLGQGFEDYSARAYGGGVVLEQRIVA